jgi:signal transduction histidine kinase
VADDSPLDASHAKSALSSEYDVSVFHDGAAVLEALASAPPPDVLVLDWVMPGVSGPDVCRFLRSSDGRKAQVAILLVTSHKATDQVVEGLASGANDYLIKPFAPEELRARVGALVRGKELLERVERAEETVSRLLTLTPDPMIVIDAHGRLTYANPEAERVLAHEVAALVGRPVVELLPALDLRRIRETSGEVVALDDVTIGDQVYSPTARLMPHDFDASATIALRNVTARRRDDTRRLDFYSIVAHDLRAPLSTIMLRTEAMMEGRRGILSTEQLGDLRKVQNNVHSMVSLINDFLDLARLEGGGYQLLRDPVELGGMIRAAIDDIRPVVDEAGLAIEIQLPTGEATIVGDRRRLLQVLTNLLANAIKFTTSGGTITVSLAERHGHAELRVADTGRGIPAEAVSRLFQRYTRVQHDRAGTGLGLMIVREIVEAHGGTVGVDSTVGEGSSFWIRLPHVNAVASGSDVMVVDDDREIREMLELVLRAHGYSVATAHHGRAALDALEAGGAPALIILDMAMPVMTGPELLRHLAGDARLGRIPVLIMSGDLSILPLAPPGMLVMQKPVQVDRLLDHVSRHVRGVVRAVKGA